MPIDLQNQAQTDKVWKAIRPIRHWIGMFLDLEIPCSRVREAELASEMKKFKEAVYGLANLDDSNYAQQLMRIVNEVILNNRELFPDEKLMVWEKVKEEIDKNLENEKKK